MSHRIRVGVSACLLGQRVRFDGGHKHDRYLTDTWGQYLELVPVCPEVECGLGTPREPMHLEGNPAAPRLVTSRTRIDLTRRMTEWARRRVKELEAEDLCGFIFKANSPSSGMARVRLYDPGGRPSGTSAGIFAGIFMGHFPLLPTEEEGALHDPDRREHFIVRLFALRRWRDFLASRPRRRQLTSFHAAHRLQLLAHYPPHCRQLDTLVANQHAQPTAKLVAAYQDLFLRALRHQPTRARQTKVLHRLVGTLRHQLGGDQRQELREAIDQYSKGQLPLVVPLTLLRHYLRRLGRPELERQWYLQPHPLEVTLRNHA